MTMNVDEEIERLKTEIRRLGAKNDDGSITVNTYFFIFRSFVRDFSFGAVRCRYRLWFQEAGLLLFLSYVHRQHPVCAM